jgi:hypothetical protein
MFINSASTIMRAKKPEKETAMIPVRKKGRATLAQVKAERAAK